MTDKRLKAYYEELLRQERAEISRLASALTDAQAMDDMHVDLLHRMDGAIVAVEDQLKIEIAARVAAEARVGVLKTALERLALYVDRNACRHEDRHRGGAIWTICDMCGQKWADDEGGYKPYRDPREMAAAKKALRKGREEKK